MRKEFEMTGNVLTMLYLGINAGHDIKKKQILLWSVCVYTFCWSLVFVYQGKGWKQLLTAAVCLMITGGFSLVSRGGLGFGDALVISSLGLYLNVWELLAVIGIGLLSASGYSILLIFIRKAGRKTELPFIPFLFLGYMGGLYLW